MKRICVSGGFDPVHFGHLRMLREASRLGTLTVILNSDAWLLRKKGFVFLPWEQRSAILGDLRQVDAVVPVDDADDTVCDALRRLKPSCFGNGGDRKQGNTPEEPLCRELGIAMVWNLGGDKTDSSSEIARRAWVKRSWGTYVTLDEGETYKVKKLLLLPGKSISLQVHAQRHEYWYIADGMACVQIGSRRFHAGIGTPPVVVEPGSVHQLANQTDTLVTVIEVQTGVYLGEDDIVRLGSGGS